mmetsp:Transcript_12899/g.42565  ORF Transcript_12899/g.42565 Transcript_12899/m.42565 type:complete len:210 (-) Transcript_12899:1989-2618(-)
MRCESCGRLTFGLAALSRNRSSASTLASALSRSSTPFTSSGLRSRNSVRFSRSMLARISNELHVTPALLALESLTHTTPASAKSRSRASPVRKRLAPSTMSGDDGFALPSSDGTRKSLKFSWLMVIGRPPAGTKTSACTRLWSVSLARAPWGVEARSFEPCSPSSASEKASSGRLASTRRKSSCIGSPSVSSSTQLVPSAMPSTRTRSP